ncbi:hypothetical protein TNCV_2260511 [Trichonephila clavipes]|nr:hypothetical protein TNCV_2260511 [Trichonephila clavipes]
MRHRFEIQPIKEHANIDACSSSSSSSTFRNKKFHEEASKNDGSETQLMCNSPKKNSSSEMNCIRLTSHCFQRRDSSSKPETDESHLVRNQDCDINAPDQELQYGFALPSSSVNSHCHPITQRQI